MHAKRRGGAVRCLAMKTVGLKMKIEMCLETHSQSAKLCTVFMFFSPKVGNEQAVQSYFLLRNKFSYIQLDSVLLGKLCIGYQPQFRIL